MIINPFELPIRELYMRLNTYAGLALTLDTRMMKSISQLEETIPRRRIIGKTTSFLGCSVMVYDLSLSKNKIRQNSSGVYSARDEQVLGAIKDVLTFMRTRLIAVSYESFETYVLNLCAEIYARERGLIPSATMQKFEKKHPENKQARCSSRKYFRALARFHLCHDVHKALDFCRKQFPQFKRWERRNVFSWNLAAWLLAARKTRDRITHNNGTIEAEEWDQMTENIKIELFRHFRFRFVNGCHQCLADRIILDRILTRFSSYAYILFKAASAKHGYNFDIFR